MDLRFETFTLPFEFLEKAMNLPENTKIASVRETDRKIVEIKVATLLPEPNLEDGHYYLALDSFQDCGDALLHPEKHLRSNKGSIRGCED